MIGTSGTILSLGDDGGRRRERRRAGGHAQPARAGEGAAPAPQAARRSGHRRAAALPGTGSAPRRPVGGRRRCSSTRSSAGLAPTSSRSATSRCARGWCSTTSTATARGSARWSAIPDVRRRSVIELGERCGYWSEHAQQVARLALTIFDQTRSVHGLTDTEREWLEYAALLHDVGVHISYERHHRHSYYLIKNGDLRGFSPQEIEVMALIARYHRQATPKKSHEGYGDLGGSLRKTVKSLSSMVRLAEGLDRSHAQAVTGLDLYPRGDDYLARLRADGDAELELWAAHRHVAPARRACSASPFDSRSPAATTRTALHMFEQADHAARVPGKAVRSGRHRRVGKDDAAGAAGKMA